MVVKRELNARECQNNVLYPSPLSLPHARHSYCDFATITRALALDVAATIIERHNVAALVYP